MFNLALTEELIAEVRAEMKSAYQFTDSILSSLSSYAARLIKRAVDGLLKLVGNVVQTGIDAVSKLIAKLLAIALTNLDVPTTKATQDIRNEVNRHIYQYELRSLNRLFQDLVNGRKSRKQAEAQIAMYGKSITKFTKAVVDRYKASGNVSGSGAYCFRLLAAHNNHCSDCPRYAARGVVRAESMPVPGSACKCRGNCTCSIFYFPTLELAVKAFQ